MSQTASAGRSRIGLIQFPGSNCDMDAADALRRHFGVAVNFIWHTETNLPKVDAIIIPGGFSYGDYLRSGALAAHSPVMSEVRNFVKNGGPVIGICNGFQILTETHLLPGALLHNLNRQFICKYVDLAVEPGKTPYHSPAGGKVLRIPIAHGEGRYYIDADGLKRLSGEGQIVYRYSSPTGQVDPAFNPNGSLEGIAGVVSQDGRVLGMMPHPERATDILMGGSADGLMVWKAFFASFL